MDGEGKLVPDPNGEAEGQFLWLEEEVEELPQDGLSFCLWNFHTPYAQCSLIQCHTEVHLELL